ncbi:MAG: hypothetical protein AAGJ37_06285 [Pseudomonadota bacterium]
MKVIFILLLTMIVAPIASAELGGKKVIFVHGLQIDDINPFVANDIREGAIEQAGPVLGNIVDEYLLYDSAKRLQENATALHDQIKAFEQRGLCSEGCYFVTGSTGDLVTRYVISRLNQWGVDQDKFSILLSFDIVGAGGGTELADVAVSIVQGNKLSRLLMNAISKAFLGIKINPSTTLGIVNDLRPGIARRIARGQYDVPRLRIAAGGETFLVSRFFISGRDDGMVPLHSACGSARAEAINSCAQKINIDGRIAKSDAPRTLQYNHFPIIMASDMSHTQIDYSGKLVAVNNNTVFTDTASGTIRYSVKEKRRTTGFWRFKKHYRTIDKPKGQLAIAFFIEEFDQ